MSTMRQLKVKLMAYALLVLMLCTGMTTTETPSTSGIAKTVYPWALSAAWQR